MSKAPTHTPSHWLDTQRPHLTEEESASVPQYHTVSELVHLSVRLQQYIRDNVEIIREYYLGYVRGADLVAVNEAINDGVLKHFPHVKSNMDDIRALLQSAQKMSSKDIHYLDHPAFGVLIAAEPVELAAPQAPPANEASVLETQPQPRAQ